MDEIARLLAYHPEFSSWLMSDSYTKDIGRGDLRRAFQTLRFRPEGEEIIRLFQRDPTALRRAASLASGFSSGADAARLTGLRSLLPRLAGVGRGLMGGLGGLAAGLLGGEGMEILAEDRAARDRIREMDRNRAVARSLDRELRSADRRGDEQRQRLEDARARQARLRREIDSSVYTAERPLPVPMPRRPASVAERDLEGRLRVSVSPDLPIIVPRPTAQSTPRRPASVAERDLEGRLRVMEPSVASIGRPQRRAPVVERMRELMPTTLVERTRRADMGVPVQDIIMAELRRQPEMRRQPSGGFRYTVLGGNRDQFLDALPSEARQTAQSLLDLSSRAQAATGAGSTSTTSPLEEIVTAGLRREPELRRQFVKSDIPGVMGTWQDLPYELQPATTLSEREIRRMIEASR